jgi:hypothetical protein
MKRSVIATALEMFHFEQAPKYRGRYRTREMAAALRPVEADPQAGPGPSRRYSEIAQPALARFCRVGSSIGFLDEPLLLQGIGQCHSQAPGEMGVAGTREPQRLGTARSIRAGDARAGSDISQRFQRTSHLLIGYAVISELPLCDDREDAGVAQFLQMRTCPGGAQTGRHRQLSGRQRTPANERGNHRLASGVRGRRGLRQSGKNRPVSSFSHLGSPF